MVNDDLEKLLNRYIDGAIDFTAYRQQRLQLIREFIDDKTPDVTVPKNVAATIVVNTTSMPRETEFRVPIINRQEPLSKAKRLQITILIMLVGTALAVWLLVSVNPPSSAKHNTNGNTATAANAVSNPAFIEAFLAHAVWDSNSLSDLLQTWQGLSREHQIQARQSQVFAQLQNELKTKLLASEKLIAVGDINAEKQQQLLNWFATQLSLEVE